MELIEKSALFQFQNLDKLMVWSPRTLFLTKKYEIADFKTLTI